jgi:hypothetical protein
VAACALNCLHQARVARAADLRRDGGPPHQIKSNQIKSNQIKSTQTKSNQIKSNQITSHELNQMK